MGKDILYNNMDLPDRAAARVCLRMATMEAVTRLERLGLAHTLRVVAVARLARCARWLWLGSHDARAAGGAAGASQQLSY